MVARCGLIATSANCMATAHVDRTQRFQMMCTHARIQADTFKEPGSILMCPIGTLNSREITFVPRVFLLAQQDDTKVYNIQMELLPRLAYHLAFLQANPDVQILYGCDSQQTHEKTKMKLGSALSRLRPLLSLLNISSSRLVVHKNVYASEVYLPMEGGCMDPVYNTWHLLHMRRMLMRLAGLDPMLGSRRKQLLSGSTRPVMMLVERYYGQRTNKEVYRTWSADYVAAMASAMKVMFPSFDVIVLSDEDEQLMNCHLCQIRMFERTDVLVGAHGAALSGALYMRPNSAVVEFAPFENDGNCLLGGSHFSRLSTVLGHNHMMHHPPYKEYIWRRKDGSSEINTQKFLEHIYSFLKSISLI